MTVRLLTARVCFVDDRDIPQRPGETITVSADEGKRLIAVGIAEAVKEPVETATAEPKRETRKKSTRTRKRKTS